MSISNIEITELEKMRRMLESASILPSDTAYSDEYPDLPTSKRALFLLPKEIMQRNYVAHFFRSNGG